MIIKEPALHRRLSDLLSLVVSDRGIRLLKADAEHPIGTVAYPLFQSDPERPRFLGIAAFPDTAGRAAAAAAKALPGCARLTVEDERGALMVIAWSEDAELDALSVNWCETPDQDNWNTVLYALGKDFSPLISL